MNHPPKKSSLFSMNYLISWCTPLAILGVGVFLRWYDPMSRTFWGDEAWRVQQILHGGSYSELLAGHYFGMEMPVQFGEYLLGKLGLLLFGSSEWAFRIWTLGGSLLSLFAFALLSCRVLSLGAATLALTLFAVSPGFLEHTVEFKPYTIETLLFLLLAISFTSRKSSLSQNASILAVLYTASTFFGSIWIFTAFVPLYLAYHFRALSRLAKVTVALSGVLSAVGVSQFLVYKKIASARGITHFWAPYAIDSFEKFHTALTETLPYTLNWYLFSPITTLGVSLQIVTLTAFLLFCLGLIFMARENKQLLAFLLFPLGVMTVLSILGEYPFFMRVSAFYYPILLLGVLYPLKVFPKWMLQIVLTLFSLFLIVHRPLLPNAGLEKRKEDIRPMIEMILQREPKTQLFVNYQASLALAFYAPEIVFDKQYKTLPTPKQAQPIKACAFLVNALKTNQPAFFLAIDRVADYDSFQRCCKKSQRCHRMAHLHQPHAYLLRFIP